MLIVYCVLALSLSIAIVYFFWVIPMRALQSRGSSLPVKEYLELESSIRTGLAQAIGGTAILLGLFFTWRNIKATEKNLQVNQETTSRNLLISQEGQITERFTRAVEQLGNDRLQVRLGGIYALERISRDSPQDYWPVLEILTAFVRTSPGSPGFSESDEPVEPPADVQAVMNVLTRRKREYEEGTKQRLDLRSANLQGASLIGCDLARAILWKTHFEGANLRDANLEDAGLYRAHLNSASMIAIKLNRASLGEVDMQDAVCSNAFLEGTQLHGSKLRGAKFYDSNLSAANLFEADLTDASLLKANLRGAILLGAKLNNTDLKGTDLTNAIDLTVDQVLSARNYQKAILPAHIQDELAKRANL